MSKPMRSPLSLPQADAEVDLVPLIDCVFLLLLFFMLCGHIAMNVRLEQISVPPTITSTKRPDGNGQWGHHIINIEPATRVGNSARHRVSLGSRPVASDGSDTLENYRGLRTMLNGIYDSATKYPGGSGLQLPQVTLEMRADADAEYHVTQEILQIVADTIDPFDDLKPRPTTTGRRPFVHVHFTSRHPKDAR